MPAQADPELAQQLAKHVVDVYSNAVDELLKIVARRLARGIDQPGWAERKLAEQVALRNEAQAVAARLAKQGPDAVATAITGAYAQGADDAGPLFTATRFIGTNSRVVDQLVRETVTAIASTHGQIVRSIDDVYRRIITEASLPGVVTGTMTRQQATQAGLDRFANQGVTGFIDSRGRNWQLDSYAEMATRTGVGRAQVAGTLDRFQEHGRDLVIVSDAPQECSMCRPWEGKVLSISGRTAGYQTVAQARSTGLLHANCRHTLGAYIEGLTKPMTHTADPEGDAARQQQRYLERGIRQWRRREAAAIDEQAAKRARARRREWEERLTRHVDTHDLKRLRYREQLRSLSTARPEPRRRPPAPKPPVEQLSAAIVPDPPALAPVTTNASTVVSTMPGPKSRVGKEVRRSLDAIEKVHAIPEGLPPVPVKDSRARAYGSYSWFLNGRPEEILVRGTGDHKATTFAHEYGHYLDHQLGAGKWLTRQDDPHVNAWKKAVDGSESVKELRAMPVSKQTRYYLSTRELWARAYAQWVALRSGDTGMQAELSLIRNDSGPRGLSQWTAAEFKPIAEALDAIFHSKGLA